MASVFQVTLASYSGYLSYIVYLGEIDIIIIEFYQLQTRARMPLTAAEKQRRYRERLKSDPEKYAAHLREERNRWKKRKDMGLTRTISNVSNREARQMRKHWRTAKAEDRKRKRKALDTAMNELTPPNSPELALPVAGPSSSKQTRARKNRRKLKNKIASLTDELLKEQKRAAKYKMRWSRAKNRCGELTPRRKTAKMLSPNGSRHALRKQLFLSNVVIHQLREKFKETKSERSKKHFKQIACGSVVKKYRLKKTLSHEIGLSRTFVSNEKRKEYNSKRMQCLQDVQNFYTRDDNSRMTAGKKETKTFGKLKKQKRLLNDSLKNLHGKLLRESNYKISYTLFCRMRPFWVVEPSTRDRDTCLCKIHDNFRFVVEKLHNLKAITASDSDNLASETTCSTSSKACMYGMCKECKDAEIPLNSDLDMEMEISWKQWTIKKEERVIKGAPKVVVLTVKDDVRGNLKTLVEQCSDLLKKYKKHSYNILNQHSHYCYLRKHMAADEVLIHIDFSENYVCKLASEIQSMHFGASKHQVSLHTGVWYVGSDGKANSFCTLSDSLHHGPAAIWAHLNPILDHIQEKHSEIKKVHFYSDGPTTQYRQKGNFFLFMRNMQKRRVAFASWNFSEAGHGKGAADGIGGAIKVKKMLYTKI